MRRYRYRCPVCRTTSPVCHGLNALAAEGEDHRTTQHGGHFPDGETFGEIDRRGRWYTTLPPLTAVHARLADALSDLHDEKAMGHYWWATAGAALILTAAAALALSLAALAL
ncbi:hypothetical protein GCM10010232_66020 [Streptomyces amakusaensis]|uniref:Uncharacterized protein n=1 Tax=Streptomyces amakusaensis TaxID=67271 RepID=A0ABW0AS63_9ACTN